MLHTLDGGEISIAIDMDQGARIASLRWRELDFVLPFRGGILTWGWYAMAPWAGRIRDVDRVCTNTFTKTLEACRRTT